MAQCIVGNYRAKRQYKNNMSGFTGVYRCKIRSYHYWVVSHSNPITHRHHLKHFSVLKLGETDAKLGAIGYRALVMGDLIAHHGYHEQHGT